MIVDLSKMRLLYKGEGNKYIITAHRPITIASVLYRLATQVEEGTRSILRELKELLLKR